MPPREGPGPGAAVGRVAGAAARPGVRFPPAGLLPGAAAEAQLLGKAGALLGIVRRGQRVFRRQIPSLQVLLAGQSVAGAQMAAQHLAFPAAVEANDRVALYRTPQRHGRRQHARRIARSGEIVEGAVHRADQLRNLLGRDIVMRHIAGDDLRNKLGIGALILRFISHFLSPRFSDFSLARGRAARASRHAPTREPAHHRRSAPRTGFGRRRIAAILGC